MIAMGCFAPPALFPLAAEGGVGGAFAYAVLMGLCMVRAYAPLADVVVCCVCDVVLCAMLCCDVVMLCSWDYCAY